MADNARVQVLGYTELARGNAVLADRIQEQAGEEFGRVAEQAAAAARARVPRRSGRLAGGVGVTRDGEAVAVGHTGGVPYAGWIEFGGTRGRPYIGSGRYLFPTALDAEPALLVAGTRAAQTEIGGMTWPNPRLPG